MTLAPRLIVVSDFEAVPETLAFARLELLLAAARPGAVMVQLRDHALGARRKLELGRRLRALTLEFGQLLAVNDRIDLALLLDADALHLGEGSVRTDDARRLVGAEMFVLRSIHDPRAVELAQADAWVLAPILSARHGRPALGLAALTTARSTLGAGLLYALGGVGADDARACLEAGAHGVAVMGAVWRSDDATALLEALAIRA